MVEEKEGKERRGGEEVGAYLGRRRNAAAMMLAAVSLNDDGSRIAKQW